MDPKDLRQAFAANLRRLRHAKGISQEDLAYDAEVNRSYLSKLEKVEGAFGEPFNVIFFDLAISVAECPPGSHAITDLAGRLGGTHRHEEDL